MFVFKTLLSLNLLGRSLIGIVLVSFALALDLILTHHHTFSLIYLIVYRILIGFACCRLLNRILLEFSTRFFFFSFANHKLSQIHSNCYAFAHDCRTTPNLAALLFIFKI